MDYNQHGAYLFNKRFGNPVQDTPRLIDKDLALLQVKMLQEELDELHEAIENGDLVEIADALGDLKYVANGAASLYGIDLEVIEDEIHRSNMSKLDAGGNPVPHPTIPGKIGKSDRYKPPAIAPLLFDQGWNGK